MFVAIVQIPMTKRPREAAVDCTHPPLRAIRAKGRCQRIRDGGVMSSTTGAHDPSVSGKTLTALPALRAGDAQEVKTGREREMQKRRLGRTGLEISVLGFGAGAVGGLMTKGAPADQERAIARAVELGINYIDTAVALRQRRIGAQSRPRAEGAEARRRARHQVPAEGRRPLAGRRRSSRSRWTRA